MLGKNKNYKAIFNLKDVNEVNQARYSAQRTLDRYKDWEKCSTPGCRLTQCDTGYRIFFYDFNFSDYTGNEIKEIKNKYTLHWPAHINFLGCYDSLKEAKRVITNNDKLKNRDVLKRPAYWVLDSENKKRYFLNRDRPITEIGYGKYGNQCGPKCEKNFCRKGYNVSYRLINTIDGSGTAFLGCYKSLEEAKIAIKKDYEIYSSNTNRDYHFHQFYHTNYYVLHNNKIIYRSDK